MKSHWTKEKGFDPLQLIENLKEKAQEFRTEAHQMEKAAELLKGIDTVQADALPEDWKRLTDYADKLRKETARAGRNPKLNETV